VRTTYSFNAYAIGTLATPYDGYHFAKGEAIFHPAGELEAGSIPIAGERWRGGPQTVTAARQS
jgi:hypothetical protein